MFYIYKKCIDMEISDGQFIDWDKMELVLKRRKHESKIK